LYCDFDLCTNIVAGAGADFMILERGNGGRMGNALCGALGWSRSMASGRYVKKDRHHQRYDNAIILPVTCELAFYLSIP